MNKSKTAQLYRCVGVGGWMYAGVILSANNNTTHVALSLQLKVVRLYHLLMKVQYGRRSHAQS